jgi:glycosyltransferase involved in cell wall biosynthesis
VRVLFVHEVDWSTKPVFEMHEFPERLAARGHEVTFLDYHEAHPGWPWLVRRRVAGRTLRHVEMDLVSLRPPIGGLPGRLLAAIASWWVASRVVRREVTDAVVLYGVPTDGPAVCWWGRRRGIPVVYRAIDVSHLLRETALAPLVRLAERRVVRTATHVSTHNPALAAHVRRLAGRPVEVSVLPPGFDLGPEPTPEDTGRLRARLGIADAERVILYRGTVYRFSGVLELARLLAPTLRRDRRLVFLVVGEGEARPALEELVRREGLADSIRVRDFVPHAALRTLFRIADVSVNPFLSTPVTDCALPSRVIQSLWAGTPCVSTPLEGLRAMVPASDLLTYRELGPEFVAEIQRVLDAPIDRAAAWAHDAELIRRRFAWDDAASELESLLGRVASSVDTPLGSP